MQPSSDKPVLVFDGDCGFCRLWIERWRHLTGDRVQYEPFQKVAEQYPEIPRESFVRAVQLILPDGEVLSAAHAVFRMLTFAPGLGWWLWVYRHIPGFAPLTEFGYRFVARHRNPLYRLTRIFWGRHFERPSFSLGVWLFLRLLGVVYFFAFLSLATQIVGLAGQNGIVPVQEFLREIQIRVGTERYWFFPTLASWGSSDGPLRLMSLSGIPASVLLILDIAPRWVLSLSWILYLSLVTVGQDFLAFQWDSLLLEAGFLAIFLAPWHVWPWRAAKSPPPKAARWLLWFLLFRLMFSSGVVKLRSGDPTWRNLTALDFHFFTQPLPTPIAWYMQQLPAWFHHTSTGFMFFVELAVPFLIFAPRLWRFVGGWLLILFQVLIALTGNYAFFNLLTIALCVLLFDDASLTRILPLTLAKRLRVTAPNPRFLRLRRWIAAPVMAVVLAGSLVQLADLFSLRGLPSPAFRLLAYLEPVHVVNGYGLFAVMTTSRPEIIIEGSDDTRTWLAYEFNFKPGDPRRAPSWVAPFQPRLDWQMWFAALGSPSDAPWFPHLMLRLLQGEPSVLALFAHNPFPQKPPQYLRAEIYDYQFSNWSERRSRGEWWRRRLVGSYFPAVALKKPSKDESQ
jgi:predicted DCC family thiol-disulfide oxidoreductase YuxK